jgi:hypothetical protein
MNLPLRQKFPHFFDHSRGRSSGGIKIYIYIPLFITRYQGTREWLWTMEELLAKHRKELKVLDGEKRAAIKKAKATKGKKSKDEIAMYV